MTTQRRTRTRPLVGRRQVQVESGRPLPVGAGLAHRKGARRGANSRRFAPWRGQLTTSAALLADALETRSVLRKDAIKLYVYADMLSDQDTRDSTHQGMTQEMTQLVRPR